MIKAEQLLWQLLENGNIVRRDPAGRTILQLAVADTLLDELLSFGLPTAGRTNVPAAGGDLARSHLDGSR
jgi:hypothetical protein